MSQRKFRRLFGNVLKHGNCKTLLRLEMGLEPNRTRTDIFEESYRTKLEMKVVN